MKKVNIKIGLSDEFEEEDLSEFQFEIPETDKININEIERLFLNAEKTIIRKAVAECLENISKKKLNLSQEQMEALSLKITQGIESILSSEDSLSKLTVSHEMEI